MAIVLSTCRIHCIPKSLEAKMQHVEGSDWLKLTAAHMSMFVNNALLGGGVRVRVGIRDQRRPKKIKGTTKPLMANLDIAELTCGVINKVQ